MKYKIHMEKLISQECARVNKLSPNEQAAYQPAGQAAEGDRRPRRQREPHPDLKQPRRCPLTLSHSNKKSVKYNTL